MKYLKRFNENLNNPSLEEVTEICEKFGIKNWTLNSDGLVDVDGNVDLSGSMLQFPVKYPSSVKISSKVQDFLEKLPLKFGKVTGDFNCSSNKLLSLEGSPQTVGGDFWCSNNNLTTLEGCPDNIGGNFVCAYNKIVSFEFFPQNLGRNFGCYKTPLEEIWMKFQNFDDIELLNDFDPIRMIDGQPTVILDRLNSFLEMTGKPTVTTLENYKII